MKTIKDGKRELIEMIDFYGDLDENDMRAVKLMIDKFIETVKWHYLKSEKMKCSKHKPSKSGLYMTDLGCIYFKSGIWLSKDTPKYWWSIAW